MINKMKKIVLSLLNQSENGHGYDHIERVLNLSLKFSKSYQVNQQLIYLIALLHDVDDYKLFGIEKAQTLENAKMIMRQCAINQDTQNIVCDAIKSIGYSKYLNGIRPTSIEAQIVSDADMCDAIGAHGILRTFAYGISCNRPFFLAEQFPQAITKQNYINKENTTGINHFFDKLLKLKDIMLTTEGKKEATKRHQFTIDFLKHFFEEENQTQWLEYLASYATK